MHSLILLALTVAVGSFDVGLTGSQQSIAKDCSENTFRMQQLGKYRASFLPSGKVRIESATWRQMSKEDQAKMIWAAAFHSTCSAGKRKMTQVRIFATDGQLLRQQLVSTTLECHGDKVGGPPALPWYLC